MADTQGDGANFLRSINHEGVTYTLNAAKTAVSVSGSPAGAWSYNNATGDSTITTELGGTLKINLDGNGSSDATTPGFYTYTAPASVEHSQGLWGLPLGDAQQGYGDSLATWLSRFNSGVELKAYNVNGNVTSFGKKDVSFSLGGVDYKYGGIGVAGSGGRDAETDFVSATRAERIEATFDTPLTNVTIGVAALFGGAGAAFDVAIPEGCCGRRTTRAAS